MKRLDKLLLVNWLYYDNELIELGDINFLTGKNGDGKTTLIDALQVVVLGESAQGIFNTAASSKHDRSLKKYLRTDLPASNPRSRTGKDFCSYIACEFYDTLSNQRFVTGIVFECQSTGDERGLFFIYDGVIPEGHFISDGQAMPTRELRRYLKAAFGASAKTYDVQKEYRRDMLAKWNVHDEQALRLLKKAVAFREITNIERFITENICEDREPPDITEMQENIRSYMRQEEEAERAEEQLRALEEIGAQFLTYRDEQAEVQMDRFLVLWSRKEETQGSRDELSNRLERRKADCVEKEAEIQRLDKELTEAEDQWRKLNTLCERSDTALEERRLDNEEKHLTEEQDTHRSKMDKTAERIRQEADQLLRYDVDLKNLGTCDALPPVLDASRDLCQAMAPFTACTCGIFNAPPEQFELARDTSTALSMAVSKACHDAETKTAELENQENAQKGILENLRNNIKDYPAGLQRLKRRLTSGLEQHLGVAVNIEILADTLEIKESEERWRGAAEGYLARQKFYLLVPPEYYAEAAKLYDRIKGEFKEQSFGLVDIEKLRTRERTEAAPGSLAEKIETDSPLARDYVNYLLGRVICCDSVSQLRQYRTAVTSEGMLYQGYVMRPLRRAQMEDAFLGRKAVALRIDRAEKYLREITGYLRIWRPIKDLTEKMSRHAMLFTSNFLTETVSERRADYQRYQQIGEELKKNEEARSHLDLLWLAEQRSKRTEVEKKSEALKNEKDAANQELGGIRHEIDDITQMKLPELGQELMDANARIEEEFSPEYVQSIGLPEYKKLLSRLKMPSFVLKHSEGNLRCAKDKCTTARRELFRMRQEYACRFPCSYDVNAEDNHNYDDAKKELEESGLPGYKEKIRRARDDAMEQFQSDFLSKLKDSIDKTEDQINLLNRTLRDASFGTDRYRFIVKPNPDYVEYYNMLMAPELMEDSRGLFSISFQQKYGKLAEELFRFIAGGDGTQLNAHAQSSLEQRIKEFTDFRTYLNFDLEVTDQNGDKQLLSRTLNSKSGGETQTPFYIALLASFAQVYHVYSKSPATANTVRLIILDEAFGKMDGAHIRECVRLLRQVNLQAIICGPPEKAPDIMPLADCGILVRKEGYRMRTLPAWKKKVMG